MRMKILSVLILAVLTLFNTIIATAQKAIKLKSPDGAIEFSFKSERKGISYSVSFHHKILIDKSLLGLVFSDGELLNNLNLGKPVYQNGIESYQLIVGKTKNVSDKYKEVLIPVRGKSANMPKVN